MTFPRSAPLLLAVLPALRIGGRFRRSSALFVVRLATFDLPFPRARGGHFSFRKLADGVLRAKAGLFVFFSRNARYKERCAYSSGDTRAERGKHVRLLPIRIQTIISSKNEFQSNALSDS